MSITIADLKSVYRKTFKARSKWRNILLELDVSTATIDSIGRRWRDNPDDCYREGLSEWLKSGERSWRDLTEALCSPTVDFSDLAITVTEKKPLKASTASATIGNVFHETINSDLVIYTEESLGTGSFGAVFKGSFKSQPCAVKVLHLAAMQIQTKLPIKLGSGEAVKAFDRECEFMKSFQHSNIVHHLSSDKHPKTGHTMLVTELMDCSLRMYFSGLCKASHNGHCELSISKDVASGLAYIHERQIVHRDLCGDNILLRLSSSVPMAKISDFGMSRLLDPSKLSSTLTSMGHRMGYLPPEALRENGERYDHSLDVFSLGVVMVQIAHHLETVKSAKDRSLYVAQIPDTHKLLPLIRSCIQDDNRRRPLAQEISVALGRLMKVESHDHTSESALSTKTRPIVAQGVVKPRGQVQAPKKDLDRFQPPIALTLEWRKGNDMPIQMGYTIQSVVIGNAVYVGGGSAQSDVDRCTILKLDLRRYQWSKLAQHYTKWFAMTSHRNQLLLIGGQDVEANRRSNQITAFESGHWYQPYPPMNIARSSSTAVSFNHYIIVAGGYDDSRRITATVEILDTSSRSWFFFEPLPMPRLSAQSTLIGSTLYIMGGLDYTASPTTIVHKVDLTNLADFRAGVETPPTLWQREQGTPHTHCTPLCAGNGKYLLTIGGWKDSPQSCIYMFFPDIKKWVKVGDLPKAKWNCTCSVLPDKHIIVAGGTAGCYLSSVDFLFIS